MIRERVLSLLLSQEGYLSGEAMSRELGVSRAAIWKAIEALRQEGYEISSAPNRGYRLEQAPDRLREGELAGPLEGCVLGSHLLCLEQIDSTNTEAKRQAMAGAPEGLVVLAEEQTGGRGRLGRSFQSPKGTGLYLSALMRPRLAPVQGGGVHFLLYLAVHGVLGSDSGAVGDGHTHRHRHVVGSLNDWGIDVGGWGSGRGFLRGKRGRRGGRSLLAPDLEKIHPQGAQDLHGA